MRVVNLQRSITFITYSRNGWKLFGFLVDILVLRKFFAICHGGKVIIVMNGGIMTPNDHYSLSAKHIWSSFVTKEKYPSMKILEDELCKIRRLK